jgi:hypothetical protein
VVDERLEAIVNKMFDRCYADGKYRQALGIAIESRRLDIVKKSIVTSDDVPGMLEYGFELCSNVIQQREFRLAVFKVRWNIIATIIIVIIIILDYHYDHHHHQNHHHNHSHQVKSVF